MSEHAEFNERDREKNASRNENEHMEIGIFRLAPFDWQSFR